MRGVTLVTTVLNDREGTEIFLKRMAGQTLVPDEVVVIDGGSKDGTWKLLQSQSSQNRAFKLIADQEVGCNVARGRDLAIEKATHDVIVSTDVGCNWDAEWFEELFTPIAVDPSIDVVIGSWAVRLEDAKSDWARVEIARRWPFRLEANPDSLGINRAIAYRKSVWETVGGYPQDLTLAVDDVVFDMLMRKPKYGFKFAAAPVVRCNWERHETLKQFCKEEHRNFLGAGEANIWRRHFFLVTGRLTIDLLFFVLGVLLYQFGTNSWLIVAALLVTSVFSITMRIYSLLPAVGRLRGYSVNHALLRLILFEYSTKIWGMLGYAQGWVNGFKKCKETRKRLCL